MGYFIAVNTKTRKILTSGQSIYGYEAGAKRGVGQFVKKENRADYVIIQITQVDVDRLLEQSGY